MPTNSELKALTQSQIAAQTADNSVTRANVKARIDAGYDYTDQQIAAIPPEAFADITGGPEDNAALAAALANSGSGYFNILNYGADPTNTTDSRQAIVDAIAAAAAVKGTVLIPRGTFKHDGAVIEVPSHVHILGEGRGISNVVSINPSATIFSTAIDEENISFKSLSISYSEKPNRSTYTAACCISIGSKFTTVEDTELFYTTVGLVFNGAEDCNAWGNYVHDTSADGIANFGAAAANKRVKVIANFLWNNEDDALSCNTYLDWASPLNEDITIALNSVKNCGACGVSVWGAKNVLVEGNCIDTTYGGGIKVAASGGFSEVENVIVARNRILNFSTLSSGGLGVTVIAGGITVFCYDALKTIYNVKIVDNTILTGQGNYISAYGVSGSMGDIVIEGNTCGGGTDTPASKGSSGNVHGIFVSELARVKIIGNEVGGPLHDGIHVSTSVTGAVNITNNHVNGANVGLTDPAAAVSVLGGVLLAIGNIIVDDNDYITNAFYLHEDLVSPICSNTMNQLGGKIISTTPAGPPEEATITLPFTENFNVEQNPLFPPWVTVPTHEALRVDSGATLCRTIEGGVDGYMMVNVPISDFTIQVKCVAVDSIYMVARSNASGAGTSQIFFQLYNCTTAGGSNSGSSAVSNNDVVKAVISGTTCLIYKNDVLVNTVTGLPAAVPGENWAGLMVQSTAGRLDDFSITANA